MKWIVAAVAAVVVVTAAAIAAVPYLVDVPRVQTLIAANASNALGRPVRFASLSVSLFPSPGITLHKLEVAEDPQFSAAPFLTLETGRLRFKLRPLLTGRAEFAELVLSKPTVTVIRDAGGRLNVATLGATGEPRAAAPRPARGASGSAAAVVLPAKVTIDDASVVYVAQAHGGAPARYRIERLDLALTAAAPKITFKGSARVTPGDLLLKAADGVVMLTPGRPLTDATVRANVTLETGDVHGLTAGAMAPALDISGALKGMLAVAGTIGAPTAAGELTLTRLALTRTNAQCPEPRRRTFTIPSLSLAFAWRDGHFTAQPMRADLARGTVTTRLDLEHGMHVRLDDIAVKALPLDSVMVDFLCQGYAVSGPLDLTSALAFAVARPLETLSGSGSLEVGAGKIVGTQALALIGNVVRVGGAVSSLLNTDVPPATFSVPMEFESIAGTYRITDGVVTTRDLLYTSRAMKVAVAGDYVLGSGAMNLDMTVTHGRGEIHAKATGTSAAPSIRVSPSSVVRPIDQKKVESVLKDLLKRFR